MKKRRKAFWWVLFLTLFLLSLQYTTPPPGPSQVSWFGMPRFVYTLAGLQFLLAASIYGFSKWVWSPEAEAHEPQSKAQQEVSS